MIFDSFENNTLTLYLDNNFKHLLTTNTQKSLEKILESILGKISLKVVIHKLKTKSLAAKNKDREEKIKKRIVANFLNDEVLQKLQLVFDTKVDVNTIKTIGEKDV